MMNGYNGSQPLWRPPPCPRGPALEDQGFSIDRQGGLGKEKAYCPHQRRPRITFTTTTTTTTTNTTTTTTNAAANNRNCDWNIRIIKNVGELLSSFIIFITLYIFVFFIYYFWSNNEGSVEEKEKVEEQEEEKVISYLVLYYLKFTTKHKQNEPFSLSLSLSLSHTIFFSSYFPLPCFLQTQLFLLIFLPVSPLPPSLVTTLSPPSCYGFPFTPSFLYPVVFIAFPSVSYLSSYIPCFFAFPQRICSSMLEKEEQKLWWWWLRERKREEECLWTYFGIPL